MIFGIILMIIFIAFAVYGVSKFLAMNKGVQVESFKKNLQTDVSNIHQLSGSDAYNYTLPNKVIRVCFKEDEYNSNMRIVYEKSELTGNINYLNLAQPICIPVINGKLQLILSKDFGEKLVTITEP